MTVQNCDFWLLTKQHFDFKIDNIIDLTLSRLSQKHLPYKIVI